MTWIPFSGTHKTEKIDSCKVSSMCVPYTCHGMASTYTQINVKFFLSLCSTLLLFHVWGVSMYILHVCGYMWRLKLMPGIIHDWDRGPWNKLTGKTSHVCKVWVDWETPPTHWKGGRLIRADSWHWRQTSTCPHIHAEYTYSHTTHKNRKTNK